MKLSAIAINCTLKRGNGESSSTDAMIAVVAKHLREQDVDVGETIRIADHDVKPGVKNDEGDGDEWPAILRKIMAADILIFGTPIWMGQPSSVAKRVLERMDAFLGDATDDGIYPPYGKVAVAAIVGNEDGAHHTAAELFQSLNDVGWTIPAMASCYWVGEAMASKDFKEFDKTPKKVTETAKIVATNAAHLAGLLKGKSYPGAGGSA
ncbi:NAD(P)H-dependent oxidoreductase [Sphingomonas sabuli]|uniref:NAD(P)H-dependent oxidoreductase n=1 Tax=Sphingomonas sabuli TaxID=2764186 RepID=A0A7G9L2X4_9SPHN|nr:NAD(P)H-dependent oxidoreductase [Sphingomonas sabuli]QNM82973.1 NAD(P)H-dependent oxidoreductase [Sphingomonas sabuli]